MTDDTTTNDTTNKSATKATDDTANTKSDEPVISIDEYRSRSRRSFLTGAVGVVAAAVGTRWLVHRPEGDSLSPPSRKVLEVNQSIWDKRSGRLAPEYPVEKAVPIQVNGLIGMRTSLDVDDWRVEVRGPDGATLDELTLADFEAMPQSELVYEHKCVEGWSSIVHWGGVLFRDFHQRYADQVGDADYVSLETPDGQYYVGWDMASILHPQTILALRQYGEPLDNDHGAPLRLATPNKYGIKCLKRIAVIEYANTEPADYWAERGYDWYSGL